MPTRHNSSKVQWILGCQPFVWAQVIWRLLCRCAGRTYFYVWKVPLGAQKLIPNYRSPLFYSQLTTYTNIGEVRWLHTNTL